MISAETCLVASENQSAISMAGNHSSGDDIVILNLDSGMYFGLEEVSARVWSLLQQPVTLCVLTETLLAEFAVDADVLEGDLRRLLTELQDEGLVKVVAATQ